MSHANAALTPRARARLGRYVVVEGYTIAQAATRFVVSYRTAKRWADRYLEQGEAGMGDRSSRPHRIVKTPPSSVIILKTKDCRPRRSSAGELIGSSAHTAADSIKAAFPAPSHV